MKVLTGLLFLLVSVFIGNVPLFGQNFSKEELAIIYGGDTSKMLRVIQVTDSAENRILNTPSDDIATNAKALLLLAKRMYLSVNDTTNPGVGIAAPQLGINKRIIWVQRFDKEGEPMELYLNAHITWRSTLLRKGREGCLSIPDIMGDVVRNYTIKIAYQSIDGTRKEEIVEGFTAVIFQHEIDHLEGILFTKRMKEQETQTQHPLAKGVNLFLQKPSHR